MSRTFPVPHYRDGAYNWLKALAGDGITDETHMAYVSSLGIDTETTATMLYEAGLMPENSDILEATAYDIGMRMPVEKIAVLSRAAREFIAGTIGGCKEVYNDSGGALVLVGMYIRGDARVNRVRDTFAKETENAAKMMAGIGIMCSFATPSKSLVAAKDVKSYQYLCDAYPVLADCMDVSESWRLGLSLGSARDHMRAVMCGEERLDIDRLEITSGSYKLRHEKWKVYTFMGITVHKLDDKVFIFDSVVRNEIHSVLFSTAQGVLYGANHHDPRAEQCSWSAIQYVGKAIKARVKSGARLDTLGTQMKKSYAVALANYRNAGSGSTDAKQCEALKDEVTPYLGGEEPWYKTLLQWDDDLAADIGTAWNMLPGVDADGYLLASALKTKMEAPKDYEESAWDDFLKYSAGVITAHIITKNPSSDFEWTGSAEDPEELDWVKSCRKGVLNYPPDDDDNRVWRVLKWDKQVEFWHYTAKDVTHIMADEQRYLTRFNAGTGDQVEANELLYALKNGSLLSGKFTPAEVRESWERGKLVGDRIAHVAGKRENTKGYDGTRETESADDIMRETLSEGESNIRRLASILDGATCGMSRSQLEYITSGIISDMTEYDALISLDYKGWSPNAVREKHMKFQDLLYSFFDTLVKASTSFVDPLFVMSRRGVHTTWVSRDGSVQGFFGTGDTILNTMMAQWAFRKIKRSGGFLPDAKIKKMSLIDDILMRLEKFGGDSEKACMELIHWCSKLGYQAEFVKTLISKVKGHFLNRLYCNSQEVITAGKIFSRASREYERQYTTIWDRVDSVFGSFLGASDRGANPVACYTLAIHRSLVCMKQCNPTLEVDNLYNEVVDAFGPRGIGAWGFPVFSQWATRESARSFSSGLSVIATFARSLKVSDPVLCNAFNNVVIAISDLIPEDRSVIATLDDPYSLKINGVIDPSVPIRRMYKIALNKAVTAPEFIRLMSISEGVNYSDNLATIMSNCEYPASVLAEFSSCLPHSVIRGITVSAERNEAVLCYVSYRVKHKARNDLRKSNMRCLRGTKGILGTVGMGRNSLMSGAECSRILYEKSRMIDGFKISGCNVPSALDVLGQTLGDGHIKVYIPAHDVTTMFNHVRKGSVRRTITSDAVLSSKNTDGDRADPVYKAYMKMSAISAIVSAYGSDPTPLEDMWSLAWMGNTEMKRARGITAKGANPMRMCARISKRNFSVMAWPNAVNTVKVDMSTAIRTFESHKVSIPFLGVAYALKAAALLDCHIGGTSGVPVDRSYVFRTSEGLFDETAYPARFDKIIFKDMVSVLSRPEAALLLEKMRNDEAIAMMDPDTFGIAADNVEINAIDILRSRGMNTVASLFDRLPGFGTLIAANEAAVTGGSDVVVRRPGMSRHSVIDAIAQSSYERNVLRLVFRMGIDEIDSQLKGDVAAMYEKSYQFLRKHGLHMLFKGFIDSNGENRSDLVDMLFIGGSSLTLDKRKFYLDAAEDYQNRESDASYSATNRYKFHYLASIMKNWSFEVSRGISTSRFMGTTINAVCDASITAVRRNAAVNDVSIGNLKASMLDFYRMESGLVLRNRHGLSARMVEIVREFVPYNYAQKVELLSGLTAACNGVEKWILSDIVIPEAVTDAFVVRQHDDTELTFELPPLQGLVLGMDDVGPAAVAQVYPAETIEEFNATLGIMSDVLDPDFRDMFRDWLRERPNNEDI
jgi:hypothetical protein